MKFFKSGLLAAVLLVSSTVHAELVSISFSGVVTAAGGVAVGELVTGKIVYQSEVDKKTTLLDGIYPAPAVAGGQTVSYAASPQNSFEVTLAGKTYKANTTTLSRIDTYQVNPPLSKSWIDFFGGGGVEGLDDGEVLALQLLNSQNKVVPLSPDMPTHFTLADLTSATGYIGLPGGFGEAEVPGGNEFYARFNITSISSVPEPTSGLMMALGVVTVAGLSRQRRKLA